MKGEFFSLAKAHLGVRREIARGVHTDVFSGRQAMLSLVVMAPHTQSDIHRHPQEQWGLVLEGGGVRIQDGEAVPVSAGDFWRTPGDVPHGFRAGGEGARLLDTFSPPREDYLRDELDVGLACPLLDRAR